MIKQLKENLKKEKAIAQEISNFLNQLGSAPLNEQKIIFNTIISLTNQLKMINNSVPALVLNVNYRISPVERKPIKIEVEGYNKKLVHVPLKKPVKTSGHAAFTGVKIMLLASDKKRFLRELNISESEIKKFVKVKKERGKEGNIFKKPRFYAKLSNKYFLRVANRLVEEGNFQRVGLNVRKANMTFLLNTYVSMMLFSVLISLFVALIIFILLLFLTGGTIWIRLLRSFWVILVLPFFVFIVFYSYPSLEYKATANKINQELPFVAIHMSAIAGSGIEPSQIFRIIALGKEYSKTKIEIKKLLNHINVYGLDLVSALRTSSETTSSKKLSELFSGLATVISTGGSLTDFLDKRAETLLFDYKTDREKYIRAAEIFMDIYMGVAIAAPMLLTLLLVLMGIGGISIGMSMTTMSLLIVAIIAALNVMFLAFLHVKQPQL